MDVKSKDKLNRRQFLTKIARYSLLSGLSTGGIFLGLRSKKNNDPKLSLPFTVCKSCKKKSNCLIINKTPSQVKGLKEDCVYETPERK